MRYIIGLTVLVLVSCTSANENPTPNKTGEVSELPYQSSSKRFAGEDLDFQAMEPLESPAIDTIENQEQKEVLAPPPSIPNPSLTDAMPLIKESDELGEEESCSDQTYNGIPYHPPSPSPQPPMASPGSVFVTPYQSPSASPQPPTTSPGSVFVTPQPPPPPAPPPVVFGEYRVQFECILPVNSSCGINNLLGATANGIERWRQVYSECRRVTYESEFDAIIATFRTPILTSQETQNIQNRPCRSGERTQEYVVRLPGGCPTPSVAD